MHDAQQGPNFHWEQTGPARGESLDDTRRALTIPLARKARPGSKLRTIRGEKPPVDQIVNTDSHDICADTRRDSRQLPVQQLAGAESES